MKRSFLFVSCDEAKHICDKAQYGEATKWERFKLTFRIAWCRITKHYSKQNEALSKSMTQASLNCLSLEEKRKLKQYFESELTKQQHQA
jgi:hypothetical protein